MTTQDIWKDHPEKVLGTTAEFVQKNPNTARAMTAAVLEAGKWIDAVLPNKKKMAETIADKSYVNTSVDVDQPAHPGPLPERHRQDLGRPEPHEVLQRRRGQLPVPVGRHVVPDPAQALGPAQGGPRLPRRREADQPDRALQAGRRADQDAACPRTSMRTSKLIDGVVWDGKDPKEYADVFKIKASEPEPCTRWSAPSVHSPLSADTRRRRARRPAQRGRRPAARGTRDAGRSRRGELAAELRRERAARARCSRVAAAAARHRAARRDLGADRRMKQRRSFPSPAKTCDAAVKVFSRPVLPQGPERPGHRLEHAVVARSASAIGFGLAALVGIPLGFVIGRFAFLTRMFGAAHQPAAAGVAAGLAADRPAGVQGRQPGGDLDDLHLLDLADDHQHRRRRAARAAGLPERRARAEPVGVEGHHPDPVPRRAALHADRRAPRRSAPPGW